MTNFLNQLKLLSRSRGKAKVAHKYPMFFKKVEMLRNNRNLRYRLFMSGFITTYGYMLYRATKSENEILRVGAAGSITMLCGESMFYCIDAVNARSKVLHENVKFVDMVRRIIKHEGWYGLYKGYSASFYSSILYGYMYFYIYKGLKVYMKDNIQPT